MKTINLKDIYPYYFKEDKLIDVPDELVQIFEEYAKAEETYERTKRRYKATYSLDRGDGIERDILFVSLSPDELYERKLTQEQLHAAIASLPDKQAKRIYAHFFLGMSKAAIARSEGVSKVSVSESIERGLCSIEKFLFVETDIKEDTSLLKVPPTDSIYLKSEIIDSSSFASIYGMIVLITSGALSLIYLSPSPLSKACIRIVSKRFVALSRLDWNCFSS